MQSEQDLYNQQVCASSNAAAEAAQAKNLR
jgi:hypothetical protein